MVATFVLCDGRGMSMRRSLAALGDSARSVEISRTAREQTEAAIADSLKLLRQSYYPDDRRPPTEP